MEYNHSPKIRSVSSIRLNFYLSLIRLKVSGQNSLFGIYGWYRRAVKEDVKGLVEQVVSGFGCKPKGWWFESTKERRECFLFRFWLYVPSDLDLLQTFLSKVLIEV